MNFDRQATAQVSARALQKQRNLDVKPLPQPCHLCNVGRTQHWPEGVTLAEEKKKRKLWGTIQYNDVLLILKRKFICRREPGTGNQLHQHHQSRSQRTILKR